MDRRTLLRGIGPAMAAIARYSAPAALIATSVPLSVEKLELSIEKLQRVLRHLGYLPCPIQVGVIDPETSRALIRFKRHARRRFRLNARTGGKDDIASSDRFTGPVDDRLDDVTLLELRQWVERGWTLPLGRFRFESLCNGQARPDPRLRWSILREDVASLWRNLIAEFTARGGSLEGPYGDTRRLPGISRTDGASPRSFHIPGRAVDLNQALAFPDRRRRYFVIPEESRGRTYWRILCSASKQDGSQGRYHAFGEYQCWTYVPRSVWQRRLRIPPGSNPPMPAEAEAMSRYKLPAGYYLDLTEFLETAGKFERVAAQRGWETNYRRTEWWHYHYAVEKQETFLDECELVGMGEERLLRAGYTIADLDRRPG